MIECIAQGNHFNICMDLSDNGLEDFLMLMQKLKMAQCTQVINVRKSTTTRQLPEEVHRLFGITIINERLLPPGNPYQSDRDVPPPPMTSLISSAGKPLPTHKYQTGSCEIRMPILKIKDGAECRRHHTSSFSAVLQAGVLCSPELEDSGSSQLVGCFYKAADNMKSELVVRTIVDILEMQEISDDRYGTTIHFAAHPFNSAEQLLQHQEEQNHGQELHKNRHRDFVNAFAKILGLHNINLTNDFRVKNVNNLND